MNTEESTKEYVKRYVPERPIAAESVEMVWRTDRGAEPKPFTMWGLVKTLLATFAIITVIQGVCLILLYQNYLTQMRKL
jgi:hypothetical protein